MKKRFLPLFLTVLVVIFVSCDSSTPDPIDISSLQYFTYNIPTAEQELINIMHHLNNIRSLESQGYSNIPLPRTQLFNDAVAKIRAGGTLTSAEEAALRINFINEVYDVNNYQSRYNSMARVVIAADQQINGLRKYQSAWGFNILNRYTVRLTLYGTSGRTNPNTGEIWMRVTSQDNRSHNVNLAIFLHEMVHIGIDHIIMNLMNIPLNTRERIIDRFVLTQWGSLVSGYRVQDRTPEYPIDVIFDEPNVLDNLPTKIEEFMKQYR